MIDNFIVILSFFADTLLSEVKQERREPSSGGGSDEDEASGSGGAKATSDTDVMSFHHNPDSDAGLQYRLQGTFTR